MGATAVNGDRQGGLRP